jgi:hypothetical protein
MPGRPHAARRPVWLHDSCGSTSLSVHPLVLVHGMPCTNAVFRGFQRELTGRREPLLIPDLPMWLGRTSLATAAQLAQEGADGCSPVEIGA